MTPPAPRNSQTATNVCPASSSKDGGSSSSSGGDGSTVPPVKDPPLGPESPFDGGVIPDGGAGAQGGGRRRRRLCGERGLAGWSASSPSCRAYLRVSAWSPRRSRAAGNAEFATGYARRHNLSDVARHHPLRCDGRPARAPLRRSTSLAADPDHVRAAKPGDASSARDDIVGSRSAVLAFAGEHAVDLCSGRRRADRADHHPGVARGARARRDGGCSAFARSRTRRCSA